MAVDAVNSLFKELYGVEASTIINGAVTLWGVLLILICIRKIATRHEREDMAYAPSNRDIKRAFAQVGYNKEFSFGPDGGVIVKGENSMRLTEAEFLRSVEVTAKSNKRVRAIINYHGGYASVPPEQKAEIHKEMGVEVVTEYIVK